MKGAPEADGWRPGLRFAGLVLLVVPFLPLKRLFGPLEGAGPLVGPGEWALGLAIFAVLAWLLARLLPEAATRRPFAAVTVRGDGASGRWAGVSLAVLAALLLAVSWLVFRHRPLLIDSIVQYFQGEIFASGRIVARPPPLPAFFETQNMILDPGGWYSQYPPLHPALLALGLRIGAAWAVPVALSLGSALLLYRFTSRAYDRGTARLALLLLLFCPFFWFMGASFMNHVSEFFFACLFLYLFERWDATGRAAWLPAAGVALGLGFLSRPLTALALGAAFGVVGLLAARRRGRLVHLPLGALGFGAAAALLLWFDWRTTGHPFLPGYVKLWGTSHGLGFHATPWGGVHTPIAGLRNELLDLSLLNLFLFEWPVPALLPLGGALAAGWLDRAWDRRLLLAFLALPAAYFFYWHRDTYLGPRFLYAGIAMLLPLTARSIREAAERLQGVRIGPTPSFRVDGSHAALLLVGLATAYSVAYGIPGRFRVYATGMAKVKVDLVGRARAVGLTEGLIFVPVSWGNRLTAQLRALGVPASRVERAYRSVGHCELDSLLRTARRERWSSGRITERLAELGEDSVRLVRTAELNGDPTLRLRPDVPLSKECAGQIRYDRKGYDLYAPHLIENRPDLGGPFVVARDLRQRDGELRARYPSLPAYLYRAGEFRPLEGAP